MLNYKNRFFFQELRLIVSSISSKTLNFKGKVRLLRMLDELLRENDRTLTKSIGSVNFQLDTRDLIDFQLLYFGTFNREVVSYLSNQIGSNQTVFWDIGANVGSIALPLASLCPNLSIHSFEPSSPVYKRLETNINLNPVISGRIHLHNCALSNLSGLVDFFVSNEIQNSGVGSLGKMHNTTATPVKIDCKLGDDLIKNKYIPKPSFIKIDVEGFEYEVIEGMQLFLEQDKTIQIIFEHEPYRFDERNMERNCVVNKLNKLGFKVYELTANGKLKKIEALSLMKHCDLVAHKL